MRRRTPVQQHRAFYFEDLLIELALEEVNASSNKLDRRFILHTDKLEANDACLLVAFLFLDDSRCGIKRVASKNRIWVSAFIVADLPQGVRCCVAARKRRDPRENQSAFDYSGLSEAALSAVDLVEVQRVAVPRQDRQLHVLALADGVTDAMKNHVADFKVLETPSRPARPPGKLDLAIKFR